MRFIPLPSPKSICTTFTVFWSSSPTLIFFTSSLIGYISSVADTATALDLPKSNPDFGAAFDDAASVAGTPGALIDFAVSVSESAVAQDLDAIGGVDFASLVFESVVMADIMAGSYLWNPVDDDQTANWQLVDDSQSGIWSPVDDSQTSTWVDIPKVF